MTKNEVIKRSLEETRKRHGDMSCRVFEVKIIKLSKSAKAELDEMFKEAKWLRNAMLANGNRDATVTTVNVKVGSEMEQRAISLGSQIKQSIAAQIDSDLKCLSTLKKHGHKVGALKYKTVCNCIKLKQYGRTYRIDFNRSRIKIQNNKRSFKVKGLHQIQGLEIACAKLIRKPSGYYFHITTFSRVERQATGISVGLDFGIKHNITTSDGEVFDISVPETKGVKLASKRMSKAFQHNGGHKTKNHQKRVEKLRKAYEKQTNKKVDKANKVVCELMRKYDFVAIQDELLRCWQGSFFGRQVHYSALGLIKAKLKNNFGAIEASCPTTQICPRCGRRTKQPLSQRYYKCAYCGYYHPNRDVKAAITILNVSMERRTKSFVETEPSTCDAPTSLSCKVSPMKQEA